MLYLRLTIVALSIFSVNAFADVKADSYNHLVYNFALVKQGISPSIVKESFTENIALEKVPEEFLPIYKQFLGLADDLQLNFENIQKHETALAAQDKQEQKEKLMSLAKTGAMAADFMFLGGSATTSISFLSKFVNKHPGNNTLVSPESLKEYQLKSKKYLTEFEFELRLARKYASKANALTLKDAEQFVSIEKKYNEDNYSKLLELDARVNGFYPIKYTLAKSEFFQKNYERSFFNYSDSLKQLSEVTYNADIKIDILEQLILLGIVIKKGEDEISKLANDLKVLSPNNTFVHFIAGLKYLAQKNMMEGLKGMSEAVKNSNDNTFIPFMAFAIQCQLKSYDSCYESLLKIKQQFPQGLDNLRDHKAIKLLQDNAPSYYSEIFGLSFSWSMDWHMLNYDRVILTNTSGFKWSNVVAGNTYKETKNTQAFRPFDDYWFSYGDLTPGKTMAINIGKSTKNILEYIDIQLKSDEGNLNFKLQHLGNGQMKYIPLSNTEN